MPHQLFQLAEQSGIAIEYADFFYSNIEAVYISDFECRPVICLSKKLDNDINHLRTVLAHELGHHFTTGKSTSKSHTFYRDKVESNREEYRAWRWAANYLIPTNTLFEIYTVDFCEAWQLADFFAVDETLVQYKLDIMESSLLTKKNPAPKTKRLYQGSFLHGNYHSGANVGAHPQRYL